MVSKYYRRSSSRKKRSILSCTLSIKRSRAVGGFQDQFLNWPAIQPCGGRKGRLRSKNRQDRRKRVGNWGAFRRFRNGGVRRCILAIQSATITRRTTRTMAEGVKIM